MASPLNFVQNLTYGLPTSNAVGAGVGQLAALDQNPFQLSLLRYPQELATTDAPHYVRFDINLPNSSKYLTSADKAANVQSMAQKNAQLSDGAAINMNPANISDAAQVAFGAGVASGVAQASDVSSLAGAVGQGFQGALGTVVAGAVVADTDISIKPKTTRTSTSISLYMPDTVVTAYDHHWNALSLTDALGKLGQYSAYGSSLNISGIEGAIKEDIGFGEGKHDFTFARTKTAFNNAKIPTELKGQLAEATGAVGANFTTFALKNQGLAVNPHLEMVFQGTQNRSYVFEFDFQPRNAKDAAMIQQIIKTFRMYAAPELATADVSNNGRYFIPPAEFDISYRFMNVENPYIAKISTCALTNIVVNWNQSGAFATFTDGMPVHIHMALTFSEIDIIYRQLIDQQGY